jgi:hypothetical protein
MTKIKCIALERKTLSDLAKAIEDFQNQNNLVSKGSIPFNFPDGSVGVILFYPKSEDIKSQSGETTLVKKEIPSPQIKIKKETFERWKTEYPTLNQINKLKRMGYGEKESRGMSKFKAFKIIGGEGDGSASN